MQGRTLKSDLLLLLAAAIWGFAFVAQRKGMEHIGPFLYNAVRFSLGTLVLLPLLRRRNEQPFRIPRSGIVLGFLLFLGSSSQQIGLIHTGAGKAGFITGLYVVLVPLVGSFLKHRVDLPHWPAAMLAFIGLFFLTVNETLIPEKGDLYVLLSAFFWTAHVLYLGKISPRHSAVVLAVTQFGTCALLSAVVALLREPIVLKAIMAAAWPLLYGGLLSVGVAFSLQVYGQKYAPPTHAAVLMSMEAVFAVLGGRLILAEALTPRSLLGCVLMLAGMLMAQMPWQRLKTRLHEAWS